MEAIYFGNDSGWWREKPADDNKLGPWVMADIENGRPTVLRLNHKSLLAIHL